VRPLITYRFYPFALLLYLFLGYNHTVLGQGQCANGTLNVNLNTPTALTGCGTPRTVNFTNTSGTGSAQNTAYYLWYVDGVFVDSILGKSASRNIVLSSVGTHTVRVVGRTAGGGCLDTFTRTVSVPSALTGILDPPRVATATLNPIWTSCNTNPSNPSNSFTINVKTQGTDTLKNYTIIWGDATANTTGMVSNPGAFISHTYTTLGEFIVLIVNNNGTCTDTIRGIVRNLRPATTTILPLPAGQLAGCAPHTIVFQDSTNNAFPGTVITWNFGVGQGTIVRDYTKANTPVSYTYPRAASQQCVFAVSITAANVNCLNPGPPSTLTLSPILIYDVDVADVAVATPLCDSTRSVTLLNNSALNCEPGQRYWYWDFGDGTNSGWIPTQASQNHVYPAFGNYTVMLIDSNFCGSDTDYLQIRINRIPKTGFLANPKRGCVPLSVTYADTSIAVAITSRTWSFGTGSGVSNRSDSSNNVSYTIPGNYRLQLTATNECGTISASDSIYVYAKPTVKIRSGPNGCAPLTRTFLDSTINQSPQATYKWTFGNGDTSTLRNPPAVTFNSPSSYNVKLVVTDSCGVDSFQTTVIVSTVPTADFTADTVCRGDSTTFTNTSVLAMGDNIVAAKWYFGDGDSSSLVNPKHRYLVNGTKTVVLRIQTDKGCVDFDTLTTVFVNTSPNVSIASANRACDGIAINFNGTATAGAGTITSYRWTFGAGITDTAHTEDTSYLYPGPGTYTVNYKVSNSTGCSFTETKNITIDPIPDSKPTVSNLCFEQFTQFRDSSTVGFSNTITIYEWDFNDDNIADSTTKNPTFKFPSVSTFKVKLRVVTNNNCSNKDSISITINPLPVASITNNGISKCKLDTFIFGNTTTGASTYTWRFGDASADSTTTSLANLNKIYSDTGLFTVRMIATTALGCKDTASQNINSRPFPIARFTVNDSVSCAPKNFTFTNTSLLANNYIWRVNGAQTSIAVNRPDTFIATSGQSFVVSLIATNTFGCRPDTAQKTMQTISNPTPDFTMSTDSGCGPLRVDLTNGSTGATSYLWRFGNGITSTATDTLATYLASALNDSTYTVKLIALNGPGCKDSLTKTVTVFPKPISSFSQNQTANCGPLPVSFTNLSVHKFGGNINDLNFRWRFGNGDSSNTKDPSETYTASAIQDTTYSIRLIVTSLFGCSDTSQSVLRVYPDPRANFSVNNDNGCGPFGVNFFNTSVPNDTGNISIMTFNWNFRNGATSTNVNPGATFISNLTKDTVYNVQLIAHSEHGCRDTAYRNILVYPKPLAAFITPNDSGCSPFNATFVNSSTPYDTGSISIMSFVWDLGNGFGNITQDAFGQYHSQQFTDSSYLVKLYATSEHGCRDTTEKRVVAHPVPVAAFTNNISNGCGPFNVQFSSNSVLASSYSWGFGDGITSSTQNPLHTYQSFPLFDTIYNVSHSVQSLYGCGSDTVHGNIIARYKPLADFSVAADSICSSGVIPLTNQSVGGTLNNWNFGNGNTSNSINPIPAFVGLPDRDTTYNIRLIVTTPYACRDTAYHQVKVNPLPDAAFNAVVPNCTPLPVTFTNTSARSVAQEWDFGDGTNDSVVNPSKTFINSVALTTRNFMVTLKAISQSGCTDTAKQNITVYSKPIAAFTSNVFEGCGPLAVTYNNQSASNFSGSVGMTFDWRLGNGDTSTQAGPTVHYLPNPTKDTIYSVKLITISEFGCKDTAYNVIRVYPKPKAQFTVNDSIDCGPLNVQFTNSSYPNDTGSINIMSFVWDFANASNSVQRNPSAQFFNNSLTDTSYNVKLYASSEHGCKDTATKFITVKPKPVASFTQDKTEGCGPFTVTFNNTSQISTQYNWNLGDGNTDNVQHPSHVYQSYQLADSTYTVSLVTHSSFGCISDTVRKVITGKYLPVANFNTSADTVCNPGNVSFFNTSVGGSLNNWNFGNGNTSNSINPVTIFNGSLINDTTFTTRLIVTSPGSCKDTAFKNITVTPLPDANFDATTPGCTPLATNINNTSLRATVYEWDFGDGTTSALQNPTKTFIGNVALANTNYTVTLKTYSYFGCTDTAKRVATVYPKPVAAFTSNPFEGCGPLAVTYGNQSVSNFSGSSLMTFAWTMGNGDTSTLATPTITFLPNATKDTVYNIRLIGISEYGCKDTAYNVVRVFPKPKAQFTVNDSIDCGPLNVQFTNSSYPNDTGSINIMSFVWDFANGSNSIQRNPLSQFLNNSLIDTSYNVKLYASSEHGCKDTATKSITVKSKPVASFTQDKTEGCGPFTVTFNNTSQISTQYHWQFGDGVTDAAQHPSHIYQSYQLVDSNYTVSLVTHSAFGCISDTVKKIITGRYLPIAGFNTSADTVCNPSSVSFFNTSVGASGNNWNFGNGNTSNSINPVTAFNGSLTNDTTFTTRLIVTSPGSCKDTVYKEITVMPLPDANFAAITPGCTPLAANINNASLRATKYEWDFGDGTSDTLHSPSKIFEGNAALTNTNYLVTLKAYSAFGCLDTAKRVAVIYPQPAATFTSNFTEGCGPLAIQYSNQSASDFSGSVGIAYNWNLGNGNIPIIKNPNTIYQANATKDTVYTTTLIATSIFGCKDTVSSSIRVYPKPKAQFVSDIDSGCTPLIVNFTNQSFPNDTGDISIMNFVWNYANGLNTAAQNGASEFINANLTDSTFKVRLFASSEHGCRDTAVRNITVHPKPVASFTQDKTSGCGPFNVAFTNTSKISTHYDWQFGDGNTSNALHPSHIYQSYPLVDSFYNVTLATKSNFGCISDTARKTVIARYIPVADFIMSDDSTCNPGIISFFNSSVGGSSNNWNFGNGNTSNSINPVIVFNGPLTRDTTYKIRLIITSPAACKDTVDKFLKVNPAPDASFAAISAACTPHPVLLNNNSQRAVKYDWDFGDGTTSSSPNPIKIFTNDIALTTKNYIVTLSAYSASGCLDTAKRTVVVYPLPLVNYTANKTPNCDTAEFSTINSSQGAATYQWKRDNINVTTAFSPFLYFRTSLNSDSIYSLKLIATSSNGCKDSLTKPLVVRPLVRAGFTSSGTSSCTNLDVSFANQTANGLSYFWLFGDGTGSPLTSPQHKYTLTGSYNVSLIAYDAYGCTDTVTKNNNVNIFEVPTANYLYTPPNAALPNSNIEFTDLSFISNGNLSHQWDFGDNGSSNNTSTIKNPEHNFSDSGNFVVQLVVQSVNNCFDTTERLIRIRPHPPVPEFSYDPPEGCLPLTVQFTNNSQFSDNYEWTFDDGQKSTEKDPLITFKFPGKYGAFLKASGPGGDAQIRKDEIITVFNKPRANFFATPVKLIIPNSTVVLTDISTDAVAWRWKISLDNTVYFTDTNKNSSFTFSKEGNYTVSLIAISEHGCLDTSNGDNVIIEVIKSGQQFIGNAFTPDGDGINDAFKPIMQGVVSTEYLFQIYNRWGERVFSTNDVNGAWDGTFMNKPAPIDTYVWTVKGYYVGNVNFSKEGNVTLIR
jgi:gliding motility-associated-like protein